MTRPAQSAATAPPPGCPAHSGIPDGSVGRLFGEEFTEHPDEVYQRLRREHGPVAPIYLDGDIPAWLVLGYFEYFQVLKDTRRFSADPTRWREMAEGRIPPDWPLMPLVTPGPTPHHTDGLEHTRLRGAISYALGRTSKRQIRRMVTRAADELIDAFAADGHVDLIPRYAGLLPASVLARLFRLPEQEAADLVSRVGVILNNGEGALEAHQQISAMLLKLALEESGSGLVSFLKNSPQDLTVEETVGLAWMVLLAGLEMSQAGIANTIVVMLTSQLRAEMNGGRLTIADAITQSLWETPPVDSHIGRFAVTDVRLGEHTIRRGDMVVLGTTPASADPAIDRRQAAEYGNRSYPAFGAGPHKCPADDLAIALISYGTEQLLHRLPGLRLAVPADQLRWRSSLTIRGLSALPVEYPPSSTGGAELPQADGR